MRIKGGGHRLFGSVMSQTANGVDSKTVACSSTMRSYTLGSHGTCNLVLCVLNLDLAHWWTNIIKTGFGSSRALQLLQPPNTATLPHSSWVSPRGCWSPEVTNEILPVAPIAVSLSLSTYCFCGRLGHRGLPEPLFPHIGLFFMVMDKV